MGCTWFLPANEISGNGSVLPALVHRVYDYRPCIFRVTFNADLCSNVNHTFIVSFLRHWADPVKLSPKLINENAFVFTPDSAQNTSYRITSIGNLTFYPYTLSVMLNGSLVNTTIEFFSLQNAHIYITIKEDGVWMKRYEIAGKIYENSSVKMEVNASVPRYIALFSTHMQYCPTYIASIGRGFDLLLSTQGMISKTSREHLEKPSTTILRDLILGCLSIAFYYYCLVNYLLPSYFNYVYPIFGDIKRSSTSSASDSKGSQKPSDKPMQQKSSQCFAGVNNLSPSSDNKVVKVTKT